jgi:hypothetical protein
MLFLAAETHHVFHACPVVPTTVENHDLASCGKSLNVTLNVHLALFPVGRSGQGHNAEDTGAHAFRKCTNGAALAGCVTPFEHDDDAQAAVFHPILKFAQFRLKSAKFRFILLATQPILCSSLSIPQLGKSLVLRDLKLKASPTTSATRYFQNTTLMMRIMSSSGEKIVSSRGKSGAAVAAARRAMSSSPKGTGRMSRTMA